MVMQDLIKWFWKYKIQQITNSNMVMECDNINRLLLTMFLSRCYCQNDGWGMIDFGWKIKWKEGISHGKREEVWTRPFYEMTDKNNTAMSYKILRNNKSNNNITIYYMTWELLQRYLKENTVSDVCIVLAEHKIRETRVYALTCHELIIHSNKTIIHR